MSQFLQYTLQGLAAGGFYALAALGLAVIFGVLGVVNFSHGACYMLGAMASALLLKNLDLGFWPALVIVPVLMFVFGVVIERLFVQWLLKLDPLYNFLLTFGLTLFTVDLMKRLYGVSSQPYEVPAGLRGRLSLGSVDLSTYQLFAAGFSLLVCAAVWLVLTKTRVGMIVRAGIEDSVMVDSLGINVYKVFMVVFGIGAMAAGFAGIVNAPVVSLTPDVGEAILVQTFVVVVIGGVGSFTGAILGGLIAGEIISITSMINPGYAYVVLFAAMTLVLMVRPHGLLGVKGRE